ncbi:hypothetical protein ES708_10250 [subsurface metagenome]
MNRELLISLLLFNLATFNTGANVFFVDAPIVNAGFFVHFRPLFIPPC